MSAPGHPFMIFERMDGYSHIGSGRRCAFLSREMTSIVEVKEIEALLLHLYVSEATFWDIEDHEEPSQSAYQSNTPVSGEEDS